MWIVELFNERSSYKMHEMFYVRMYS